MDFGRPHEKAESVTSKSNIRILPPPSDKDPIDTLVLEAANTAVANLFQSPTNPHPHSNSNLYPERTLTRSSIILPNSLVVIFESFDNLNFVYATPGSIFNNRNGHFHHDDFLYKPFGCKIRSRNNQGLGFVYLLRPTAELWARSLNHRTQIIHELDASVIVFQLGLRPGMVVCESGTGSGAMSHAIMRTIAPGGRLHTFEFNQSRVVTAIEEFKKNKVEHLVTVYHRDVCGEKEGENGGGFGKVFSYNGILKNENVADAVFLDLPEPWLAVPHAAKVMKGNGRIGSYSPCVEQSQRTIQVMKEHGFHSIKTMEVRLREHYVDDVELEMPPTDRLPEKEKIVSFNHTMLTSVKPTNGNETSKPPISDEEGSTDNKTIQAVEATEEVNKETQKSLSQDEVAPPPSKRTMLCARPFGSMRGHTAFLTFATVAYKSL